MVHKNCGTPTELVPDDLKGVWTVHDAAQIRSLSWPRTSQCFLNPRPYFERSSLTDRKAVQRSENHGGLERQSSKSDAAVPTESPANTPLAQSSPLKIRHGPQSSSHNPRNAFFPSLQAEFVIFVWILTNSRPWLHQEFRPGLWCEVELWSFLPPLPKTMTSVLSRFNWIWKSDISLSNASGNRKWNWTEAFHFGILTFNSKCVFVPNTFLLSDGGPPSCACSSNRIRPVVFRFLSTCKVFTFVVIGCRAYLSPYVLLLVWVLIH